jgi:hypothetical protein
MTQAQALKKLRRSHWRSLERLLRSAYQAGFEAGQLRAHGQSRRGRTIREDATVAGLVELIERHFGLRALRLRGAGRERPVRAAACRRPRCCGPTASRADRKGGVGTGRPRSVFHGEAGGDVVPLDRAFS